MSTKHGSFNSPILFIGPYPPIIGGTAAMLNRLVPAIEETGTPCRVFNTLVGSRQGGLKDRIQRLLFFMGIAWRTMRAPEKIVHCHTVNFANLLGHGFVLLACQVSGKRSVITLHAGDLQQKFSSGRSRTISRIILKMANMVTTVTPELDETMVDLGISKSCFISNDLQYLPPGADDPDSELPPEVIEFIDEHSPIVVLVGAIDRPYGVDILLRATARLQDSFPKVGSLIIAFKSNNSIYSSEISDLIENHKLQDCTLFPAPFSNIAKAIKQSDVFVRPTLSDGDSIAVREALSLDLPVVASDVGFRPNGVLLFKVGDHEDLADVVQNAIETPRQNTNDSVGSEAETLAMFFEAYRQAML